MTRAKSTGNTTPVPPMSLPQPPREKHGDGLLVVTVLFTELGHQIFLLKVRAENNPQGPKNVEKQAVRTYVRARPDENEHEKIEGMADPEIWTAEDEVWCSELPAAKMGPDGSQTKCVKVSECPHPPRKAHDGKYRDSACQQAKQALDLPENRL